MRLPRLFSLWFGILVTMFLLLLGRDSQTHVSTYGFSGRGNVFFAMSCSEKWLFGFGPQPKKPFKADSVFNQRFAPTSMSTEEYYEIVEKGFTRIGWKKFEVGVRTVLTGFIILWFGVVFWRIQMRKRFEVLHLGDISC